MDHSNRGELDSSTVVVSQQQQLSHICSGQQLMEASEMHHHHNHNNHSRHQPEIGAAAFHHQPPPTVVTSVDTGHHHHLHQHQQHHHQTAPSQQQLHQMTQMAVTGGARESQHHQHHQHQHVVQQLQHHHQEQHHGIYKNSTAATGDVALSQRAADEANTHWVPTSEHQVIILTAADAQVDGASILQAADQGQLIGHQVWDPQTAPAAVSSAGEYHHRQHHPHGPVQLSDGTIIPAVGGTEYVLSADPQLNPAVLGPHTQQQGLVHTTVVSTAGPAPSTPTRKVKSSTGSSSSACRRGSGSGSSTKSGSLSSLASKSAGRSACSQPAVDGGGSSNVAAARRKRKLEELLAVGLVPGKLEHSVEEVKRRFQQGCDCNEESCFRHMNAAMVFQHRLNIAELSKHEHDMYLMGVTMACLSNPDETARHKERKRMRARYVFQGKDVCLNAFLYLENCTHYQVKRIRKHVLAHGVTPRVHGNHGKLPHNTLSLDIYRHASEYLTALAERLEAETAAGAAGGGSSRKSRRQGMVLVPSDLSRKSVHIGYLQYMSVYQPDDKVMSYSAFLHFLRTQFTHLRFAKLAPGVSADGFQPALKREAGGQAPVDSGELASPDAHLGPPLDADGGPAIHPEEAPVDAEFDSIAVHHDSGTFAVTPRQNYVSAGFHYSVSI